MAEEQKPDKIDSKSITGMKYGRLGGELSGVGNVIVNYCLKHGVIKPQELIWKNKKKYCPACKCLLVNVLLYCPEHKYIRPTNIKTIDGKVCCKCGKPLQTD